MGYNTDFNNVNGSDSTILLGSTVKLKALGGAFGLGGSDYTNMPSNKTGCGNAAGGNWYRTTPAASTQKSGTTGESSIYGYCNNAGNGITINIYGGKGGGGGGAGGAGTSATSTQTGTGGAAFGCSITGTPTYYAAGGGGSSTSYSGVTYGTGGYGADGNMYGGYVAGSRTAEAGVNDTGSGGASSSFGYGSAGICIIRIRNTPTIVSGGTSGSLTFNNNTYYYTFTSTTGTNTISFPVNTICQVLVVGGGGGGSGGFAGAGGAGGGVCYYSSYTFIANTTYTINIGTGGNGGNPYLSSEILGSGGSGGNPSTITTNSGATNIFTANGGGGGGISYIFANSSWNYVSAYGGSTSLNVNNIITYYYGGAGYTQGNGWYSYSPGGGAGAGQNGVTGTPSIYGNGGNGYKSFITGTDIYYAGGGTGGPAGLLSANGGTNGLGQNNYGGGGRGYSSTGERGQNGTSGCVIIAFSL